MSDSMHVAFVSDVHGNAPALQAVLSELDRRGPLDVVVGGGDYVFGGAYPERCMTLVREREMQCVRGNTDEWVVESATAGRIPAKGYEPGQGHTGFQLAVDDWAAKQVGPDSIRFLADLPIDWRVTGPSGQRLIFVHATPWSTHPSVQPDADEAILMKMLDESGADVLLYGHIHKAYIRQLGDRTVGCVGSVGMPFDGDPRPCFLLASDDGNGWRLEHLRVSYDRDAYLADLARSGLPNAAGFIEAVRNARPPGQ